MLLIAKSMKDMRRYHPTNTGMLINVISHYPRRPGFTTQNKCFAVLNHVDNVGLFAVMPFAVMVIFEGIRLRRLLSTMALTL